MSTCTSYVPTHIYIADVRKKEVSKCILTSEPRVFRQSRDYQWLFNLKLISLVSVVWGLSVVGGTILIDIRSGPGLDTLFHMYT